MNFRWETVRVHRLVGGAFLITGRKPAVTDGSPKSSGTAKRSLNHFPSHPTNALTDLGAVSPVHSAAGRSGSLLLDQAAASRCEASRPVINVAFLHQRFDFGGALHGTSP